MKIEPRTFTLPNGEVLTVRSLCADDAEALNAFRYATYSETYFMARYPEECVYSPETAASLAACEESPFDFEVGAFDGKEQVGRIGVCCVRSMLKYRHRAYVGISIEQKYWGCGLGSYLMQLAIDQTRANGFEQLELGVYSDNSRAIHLYEKFGFKRYGIQPRAFKLKDGTYRDEIIMVKML